MHVCVCTRVLSKTIAWFTFQAVALQPQSAFRKFHVTRRTHHNNFSNKYKVYFRNAKANTFCGF